MEIRTVGVLGCGLMGSGIAQVAASSGYKTIVREVNDTALQAGLGRIKKFLADGVAKGKVTEDAQNKTLANLTGTANTADFKECDIVIEAIVENLDEKRAARRRNPAAGSIRRPAFLQSRAADEARRGDPRADHERGNESDADDVRDIPRQGADCRA